MSDSLTFLELIFEKTRKKLGCAESRDVPLSLERSTHPHLEKNLELSVWTPFLILSSNPADFEHIFESLSLSLFLSSEKYLCKEFAPLRGTYYQINVLCDVLHRF